MANAARTFRQIWRVGRRVRENAAPNRVGSVKAVLRTGPGATIIVNVTGRPSTSFRPSQLTPL